MTLFRTVEPAVEPVTLAEAKAHLRLVHDSEDALLSGLIRAARDEVERSTGLAMIDQSWRLALDRWPRNGWRGCWRGRCSGGRDSCEAGLQMASRCASVLTYLNVRSAPMLARHHFRLGLTRI